MLDTGIEFPEEHAYFQAILLAEALKPSSIQEETEIPLLSGRKKLANWDSFKAVIFLLPYLGLAESP